MDRQINYAGAVPLDADLLLTNKNTMLALGSLMQAVLGSSVSVDGLSCTPNTPAALNVLVGAGSIYGLQNVDGTAYGSIGADTTNQTVKQGLILGTTTLSCPAPATTGQSVVYLVQAAYQDTDVGSTVLPYYNAANPNMPWSGPNNTGVSQNTVRKGVCLIGVKTGTPATTGTQTTPAPDAGYTGLYAVTVANGQTTVTSGNIKQLTTAPFIATKLTGVLTAIQQDTPNYALDTSGAANTIAVALSPAPTSLTDGMVMRVKIANSSTGATVLNPNGLGNIACKTTSGSDFTTNTVVANGIYTFVYDANGNRMQLQGFQSATATGLLPANNLSDVSNAATSRANLAAAPLASPTFTGTPAAPTAAAGTNTTQLATTAFVNSALTPNTYQASPSNPTATTSTTGLMAGLAGAITPTVSGKVMITICGSMAPSAADATVQIRTGTGTAPVNGASPAGAAQGNIVKGAFTGSISMVYPFSVSAIVTGLTLGTPIWIDLGVLSTSGSVTLTNVGISACEVH